MSSLFSENALNKSLENFLAGTNMLLFQDDGTGYNAISNYGVVYLISLPFIILGIIVGFIKENRNKIYMIVTNCWLISSILLLFVCEPNINRCNIIMFLLIIYTIIGLDAFMKTTKKLQIPMIILYILSFIMFNLEYFNIIHKKDATFESDIQEVVEYVDKVADKKIYITSSIKDGYIYFLFFGKDNPYEYYNTREVQAKNVEFQNILSYKNYIFYVPEIIQTNDIFIIDKNEKYYYDESKFNKIEFKRFIILEGVDE